MFTLDRPMTTEQFTQIVGSAPLMDELERANCKRAGQPGHWHCGVCKVCGMPKSRGCEHDTR